MNPTDRYRTAIDALSRDDYATARTHAQALLRAQPDHPAILQLLGIIAAQAGDPATGVTYFRRAITRGAATADNQLNLAKALLASGAHAEAAAVCDDPANANDPDLARLRAEIAGARGDGAGAIEAWQRLVDTDPDDFAAWNNLGNARHAAGDLQGGLAALDKARATNPKSALVHLNIGRILLSLDRHEDACLVLEQATLLDPKDPVPLLELGRTLTALGHSEDALRALGTAARLDQRDPAVFVAIGLAFTDLAERAKAEQAFRVALQVAPSSAAAHLNLGVLLEKDNRIAELDALLVQAAEAGVPDSELDYLRALASERHGDLTGALEFARRVTSPAVDPTVLQQVIGQLADRLGQTAVAIQAFDAMNLAASRTPLGLQTDRTAYQRDIDRRTAATTAGWFARWPTVPTITAPPAPVFLIGFPRSGTTLLDTLLLGHSQVHVLEEIPLLAAVTADDAALDTLSPAEVAELRARYFAELDRVSPPPAGALVVDKNPLSIMRIPLLHRLFPDAKIILAMRHPVDVVLSCWMQNFKPTEAMASFLDLDNASRTYDRVFGFWENARAIFPLAVHELRYEDMVRDTEGTLRPLIDFLGLDWQAGLLDHQRTAQTRGHIRTPSYAQVTEPVYARASGRWTRYRDQLRDALPVLAPWCERYGYPVD